MPLSARDVARYFLAKADPDAGDTISNLKLQKLCYYAQGFALALAGKPLFPETIEAWEHGPVVPTLYHAYKSNGSSAIPPEPIDLQTYPSAVAELLDDVYKVYGQYSAWKLRNMTHDEPPWKDARAGDGIITHTSMQQYFSTLIE